MTLSFDLVLRYCGILCFIFFWGGGGDNIAIFARFFYRIVVFRTPQCPPPGKKEEK